MISSVSSLSAGLLQPIDLGAGPQSRRNALEATRHRRAPEAEQSDSGPAEAASDPGATRELSIQGADNESADGLSDDERAVAAQAGAMEQAARQELAAEQREQLEEQHRAQVEQQNGQARAGAFNPSSASTQIGQFLSLIA